MITLWLPEGDELLPPVCSSTPSLRGLCDGAEATARLSLQFTFPVESGRAVTVGPLPVLQQWTLASTVWFRDWLHGIRFTGQYVLGMGLIVLLEFLFVGRCVFDEAPPVCLGLWILG